MAASPAPPTSERLCRRRPFIVTIGRGRRQGCAAPPILTRLRSAALLFNHDKIGTSTPRFAAASRSCDPDPARPSGRPVFKRTDGGSHAHLNRTHPGMACGSGSNPSGDCSTRDACPCTPGRSEAHAQAQAALGRVTGGRGSITSPATPRKRNRRCVDCTCDHPFASAAKRGLLGILS